MSSVLRGLQILERIVDSPRPLTHAELARLLNIPKSTLSQILALLEKANYIGSDGRLYYADVGLLALGQRIARAGNLHSAIRPLMDRLAERTGETVLLGSMVGNHIMYLEQSPSPLPIRYVTTVGQPRPLHCTAGGRVLLAFSNRSSASLDSVPKLTSRTITDVGVLDALLVDVRKQGHAINIGESVQDVSAISVPLRNERGDLLAALTVTGPSNRMSDMRKRILPLLLRTVEQASMVRRTSD
jgi:DNA-binding IclR family transcriptional regulator